MINRWADLLASAATGSAAHPHFVQLLSEMTRDQALLLERIVLNEHEEWQLPDRVFGDVTIDLDSRCYTKHNLDRFSQVQFPSGEELLQVVKMYLTDLAVYCTMP